MFFLFWFYLNVVIRYVFRIAVIKIFVFNFLWENTCILHIWKLFAKQDVCLPVYFPFSFFFFFWFILLLWRTAKGLVGFVSFRFEVFCFLFLSPKMTYCDICTWCGFVPLFDGIFCSLFEFVCCCSIGMFAELRELLLQID